MNTSPPSITPPLGYLVSRYPAVSHTFILREVQRLRALGHTVHTASINPPDRARADMDAAEGAEADATYGIKTHGLAGAMLALLLTLLCHPLRLVRTLVRGWQLGRGPKGLAYAVEAAMVARWMARHGLRHLHVHFGNVGATVGLLTKALNHCHLSCTIHGPDEFDDVPGQQLRAKVEGADALVCISQFARGQLMRLSEPAHWGKLQVCRLGVDPQQFPFTPRLPVDQRPLRLLCVGRLTPAKGQVVLLQALHALLARGVAAQLTLVGDGPDRGRIEQTIQSLDLAAHVSLTGAVGQARVRAEMDQADLFVLPSFAEGIPVVLMEAMASGLPCVSSPVNGIPELIEHRRTGWLSPAGDAPALADALQALAADAGLREQLAQAAAMHVRLAYDLERNTRALSTVFRHFPDQPASGAPSGERQWTFRF